MCQLSRFSGLLGHIHQSHIPKKRKKEDKGPCLLRDHPCQETGLFWVRRLLFPSYPTSLNGKGRLSVPSVVGFDLYDIHTGQTQTQCHLSQSRTSSVLAPTAGLMITYLWDSHSHSGLVRTARQHLGPVITDSSSVTERSFA